LSGREPGDGDIDFSERELTEMNADVAGREPGSGGERPKRRSMLRVPADNVPRPTFSTEPSLPAFPGPDPADEIVEHAFRNGGVAEGVIAARLGLEALPDADGISALDEELLNDDDGDDDVEPDTDPRALQALREAGVPRPLDDELPTGPLPTRDLEASPTVVSAPPTPAPPPAVPSPLSALAAAASSPPGSSAPPLLSSSSPESALAALARAVTTGPSVLGFAAPTVTPGTPTVQIPAPAIATPPWPPAASSTPTVQLPAPVIPPPPNVPPPPAGDSVWSSAPAPSADASRPVAVGVEAAGRAADASPADAVLDAVPLPATRRDETPTELDSEELEELDGKDAADEDRRRSLTPLPPLPPELTQPAGDRARSMTPPPPASNGQTAAVSPSASPAPPAVPAQAPASAPPPPAAPPQPASGALAEPGGLRPRKKRRTKQWFEEIFDDDYLRTLPFLTAKQTEREAGFIAESLAVPSGGAVLDLACGYGRHAMELAAKGYKVTGLDLSLPLLIRAADAARRSGLSINFIHGDMREMTFENEFDGAYSMFTSFGYFDDDTNRKVAANLQRAIKPGGKLVLDLVNRDYLVRDLPTRVWWQGDGCVILEEVDFNYFSSRLQVQRSIIFEDGRQLEQEISIRAYSLHEIGKVLHHSGFRVTEVSGGLALRGKYFGADSRQLIVLAEKK